MTAVLDEATRNKLLADPGVILGDRDLMRALVAAREAELGDNVIDIRGRAMEALETRLDRLESTHESVIAAAYDNQSGMAVIHRAVIALLEPADLEGMAEILQSHIAPILRVETLRLLMETSGAPENLPEDVVIVPDDSIARMVSAGRRAPRGDDIVLRAAESVTRPIHGRAVASEALLPLDLGAGLPRAMLLMGSADQRRFTPAQGTDLLRFFGQVARLILLRTLRG